MRKLSQYLEGSAAMIGVVIAGLIAIIIGVLVWYKIDAALISAVGGMTTLPAGARAAWNTTNTTANTVWTLFPIVAIVVVAGVILAIVMGFGRQTA